MTMATPSEDLKEQLRSLRIDRSAAPATSAPKPPTSSRKVWIGAIVVAGVIAGYWWLRPAPLQVQIARARVERGDQPITGPVLSGSGYLITAEKYIAIGVRVPGRIERFLVDEGDHVEIGQLIVELDDRDYRAQAGRAEASLRVAQANRKLAESDLARMKKLSEQGVTSRQELDQSENRYAVAAANVSQAENDLIQARTNLDDTKLRSPVRGVVLAKLRGVGEIAVPGGFAGSGDLLRLADLTELRAEVDVSEADLANVHLGQDAEIVPDAYPQQKYGAKVVKLYPQVNRQKGTLKVEVKVAEPDAHLLPDMSVRVTFLADAVPSKGGEAKPVVVIPRGALRRVENATYVWIVVAERLAKKPVEVDREIGDEVPVTRGLNGGEALVVGPEGEFREGRAVRVASGS
jgi:RND family efflux transporter MFP subunit